MPTTNDTTTDLEALERFVVNNDELLKLEERVGRFNIFDALGIVRAEIRHSEFLAWLLDPSESHGQGSLFLSAILMDLLQKSHKSLRAFSPIELDGAELRGVRIRREYRNIDILIECDEPKFVIAVENKVDTGEHSGQLTRYKEIIKLMFSGVPAQLVYLTREGDEPSDEDWTVYTYRDIHDVLSRVRRTNAASIGGDVLTFVDHYLSLIGSRFMDDELIDDLCQKIYKNHRQAIDLILDRVRSIRWWPVEVFDEVIARKPNVKSLKPSAGWRGYCPQILLESLPAIGSTKQGRDPRAWIGIWFSIANESEIRLTLWVSATTDDATRSRVVERLIQHLKQAGLGLPRKATPPYQTPIYSERIATFVVEDRNDEALATKLHEASARLESVLADFPAVLSSK